MRKTALFLTIFPALSFFAVAVAAREPQTKTIFLDQKSDSNTWINREGLLYLAVNVFLTRGSDKQAYIPLEIGVANPGDKEVVLTRDSFTLIDQDGNTYPVTPPKEIRKNYGRLSFDRSKAALTHTTVPVFNGFHFVRSQFEPNPRVSFETSNMVVDKLELPSRFAMMDILYFKMPSTGLKGKYFELRLTVKGLDEAPSIKFMVD